GKQAKNPRDSRLGKTPSPSPTRRHARFKGLADFPHDFLFFRFGKTGNLGVGIGRHYRLFDDNTAHPVGFLLRRTQCRLQGLAIRVPTTPISLVCQISVMTPRRRCSKTVTRYSAAPRSWNSAISCLARRRAFRPR